MLWLSLMKMMCTWLGSWILVNLDKCSRRSVPDKHPVHSARWEEGEPNAGPIFSIRVMPERVPMLTPKLMVSCSWDDPSDTTKRLSLSGFIDVCRWCMTSKGLLYAGHVVWHKRSRSHWDGNEDIYSAKVLLLVLGSGLLRQTRLGGRC